MLPALLCLALTVAPGAQASSLGTTVQDLSGSAIQSAQQAIGNAEQTSGGPGGDAPSSGGSAPASTQDTGGAALGDAQSAANTQIAAAQNTASKSLTDAQTAANTQITAAQDTASNTLADAQNTANAQITAAQTAVTQASETVAAVQAPTSPTVTSTSSAGLTLSPPSIALPTDLSLAASWSPAVPAYDFGSGATSITTAVESIVSSLTPTQPTATSWHPLSGPPSEGGLSIWPRDRSVVSPASAERPGAPPGRRVSPLAWLTVGPFASAALMGHLVGGIQAVISPSAGALRPVGRADTGPHANALGGSAAPWYLFSPAGGGVTGASGAGGGVGPAGALLVAACVALLVVLSARRLSLELLPWRSVLPASPPDRPG
jgi:hypothetical protein